MSLSWRCEVCDQPKGQPCSNTINPEQPLPGRGEHLARVRPPGQSKEPQRNEAMC